MPAMQAARGMASMNWLSDVTQARPLVTERDRQYVGEGVLSGLLLDLIAASRLRGRRPSGRQVQWVARMRGLSEGDTRDLQHGIRRWRR